MTYLNPETLKYGTHATICPPSFVKMMINLGVEDGPATQEGCAPTERIGCDVSNKNECASDQSCERDCDDERYQYVGAEALLPFNRNIASLENRRSKKHRIFFQPVI